MSFDETFTPLRQPSNKDYPRSCSIIGNSGKSFETDNLRSKYGIEADGIDVPPLIQCFEEIGLPYKCLAYLKEKKKFKTPTPIQMQAFSCLLMQRDCICLSSTGTGKTHGYILPLCLQLWREKILESNSSSIFPYSLIVVPTRELMYQVLSVATEVVDNIKPIEYFPFHQSNTDPTSIFHSQQRFFNPSYQGSCNEFGARSHNMAFNPDVNISYQKTDSHFRRNDQSYVVGVGGGIPIQENLSQLSGYTKILVATPGRLIDLCERGHISLDFVRYFVIDECDKMLDMGMEEQLRRIIAMVTVNKGNILASLWSATLPTSLERLARSAVVNPIYICTGVKDTVPRNIMQTVIFVHTYKKPATLLDVLRKTYYPPVIIFTNSKYKADELVTFLHGEQFHVAAIHSEKSQTHRNEVLESFRKNEFDVLVATDLISRGLDIPAVTHVIHFDTPDNIEDYVHRCGRTGRFGRDGLATTLLTLNCTIAKELKDMLEGTGNEVPIELRDLKMFGKKLITTDMGDRLA